MSSNLGEGINPSDIRIETWPPRPKGGQHVGFTDCGIKLTHIPTETEVVVNIGRSQHVNRQIAMEMLAAAMTHPRFPRQSIPSQITEETKNGSD